MGPNLGLLAASGLASFLLRITAEWLVCLLLVRVASSAKARFCIWLAMIFAFVAQWVWMGTVILRAALAPGTFHLSQAHSVTGTASAIAGTREVAVPAAIAGSVAPAMTMLLACYVLMLAWRAVGAAAARIRLARAMHYRTAPQERLASSFREALEQTAGSGSRLQDCELWVLPGLPSPATLGWWRPRVIVPPICETQDAAELEVVFWHELKHVQRRDGLWNAVMRVCGDLLWFHPCVHHAIVALRAERELACDAAVVRDHPQSRDIYATCLVRFARYRDLATHTAAVGIEMASGAALLGTRVRSILGETERVSRLSRAWRTAASVILMVGMAVTLPALNVLFAAEVSGSAIGPPIATGTPLAAPRNALKSVETGMKLQASSALSATVGTESSASTTAALPHDDSLAAEHRAAMDIVTESTGMDALAPGTEGRGSHPVNATRSEDGSASQSSSPSWTSVAVDAAERTGPLWGGHDGDGHH